MFLRSIGVSKDRKKKIENPIPVKYKLAVYVEPIQERNYLHKWIGIYLF